MPPKTTQDSFKHFLETVHGGEEGLAANADIQQIIALQRLWEGAAGKHQDSPYIITETGDEHPVPSGAAWLDRRKEVNPHWWSGNYTPAVDTIRVATPYTTTGYPSMKVHGLIDMLIEELGHTYDYKGKTQKEKFEHLYQTVDQREKHGDRVYHREDLNEHKVHGIIAPYLRYLTEVHGGVLPENVKQRIEAGDTTMLKEAEEWMEKESHTQQYEYQHPKY